MTSPTAERLAHLEETIARLEELIDAPTPDPTAVNPNGTPGNVAPGELIESAWGNATANSISRLWGYPIVARAATSAVTTDGNGDFAITTGFAPLAAIGIGAQPDFAVVLVLREINAIQCVFRAYAAGGGVHSSTIINVSYIILAAAGTAGT